MQRDAAAVVAATDLKVLPLLVLRNGGNMGGLQHQKARLEVLERLRRAAVLSPDQMSQWEDFKNSWDREMVEAHGENWAEVFAELVQQVLTDLGEGRSNALSVFMHNETSRVFVFSETLALLFLGAPRSS